MIGDRVLISSTLELKTPLDGKYGNIEKMNYMGQTGYHLVRAEPDWSAHVLHISQLRKVPLEKPTDADYDELVKDVANGNFSIDEAFELLHPERIALAHEIAEAVVVAEEKAGIKSVAQSSNYAVAKLYLEELNEVEEEYALGRGGSFFDGETREGERVSISLRNILSLLDPHFFMCKEADYA